MTTETTDITIEIDTAVGPRVCYRDYGWDRTAEIEAAIPEGQAVDWSSAVRVTPAGCDPVWYHAPLVPAEWLTALDDA